MILVIFLVEVWGELYNCLIIKLELYGIILSKIDVENYFYQDFLFLVGFLGVLR